MSIAVIQLARFGDIFQTWPTLKALKRRWPGRKIHLIVRERFQDAAWAAAEAGIEVVPLPSAAILAPILEDNDGAAVAEINAFIERVRALNPGHVINLSFSPFSSYLTDALTEHGATAAGYTRHADGYLKIPDDTSAYFYAQVGIGRANRYHVSEIFAAVAGVDLTESDFHLPVYGPKSARSVLVHIGASQNEKTYPPEMWRDVLRELQTRVDSIVIAGSAAERAVAETICRDLNPQVVSNRAGQSTMEELCRWVGESALVIGADSAPLHIAALTGTPVLNLSCAAVNFWETGPLSAGSRVLYSARMGQHQPAVIAGEAMAMLENREGHAYAGRKGLLSGYHLNTPGDDFHWRLIQALYTAADYPPLPQTASPLAFQRLFDTAELALQQLGGIPNAQRAKILENVDEILTQLPVHDDRVRPIIGWFQTERLRMGPAGPEAVLERTRELFEQLQLISAVYHRPGVPQDAAVHAIELAKICAPALREFDFPSVRDHFQELLSVLQDLSRHATKVGEPSWSSVLNRVEEALQRRDFIELADILEFEVNVIVSSCGLATSRSVIDPRGGARVVEGPDGK